MRKHLKSRIDISKYLIGIVKITRPLVTIGAPIYTLLGVYLVSDIKTLLSSRALCASIVVGLIVTFSLVINDYHDVAADRLSHPERPIPSGQLSSRFAGFLAIILALTAISVALTLGWLLIAIAIINITLCILYSYILKNTVLIGNIVVGLLNASIPVYGGLSIGNLTSAIWILSLLGFLFTIAQEILFAVGDLEGDALIGLQTTATYLGEKAALYLFQFFVLAIMVITILFWRLDLVPNRFFYAMIPCSILPLMGISILLCRRVTNSNIHLAIRVVQFVRLFSLIPGVLLK